MATESSADIEPLALIGGYLARYGNSCCLPVLFGFDGRELVLVQATNDFLYLFKRPSDLAPLKKISWNGFIRVSPYHSVEGASHGFVIEHVSHNEYNLCFYAASEIEKENWIKAIAQIVRKKIEENFGRLPPKGVNTRQPLPVELPSRSSFNPSMGSPPPYPSTSGYGGYEVIVSRNLEDSAGLAAWHNMIEQTSWFDSSNVKTMTETQQLREVGIEGAFLHRNTAKAIDNAAPFTLLYIKNGEMSKAKIRCTSSGLSEVYTIFGHSAESIGELLCHVLVDAHSENSSISIRRPFLMKDEDYNAFVQLVIPALLQRN